VDWAKTARAAGHPELGGQIRTICAGRLAVWSITTASPVPFGFF
jgi:hypothetical protein